MALVGAGQMGGALARGWVQALRRAGGMTLSVLEQRFDPDLLVELEAAGAILNPPEPGPADVIVFAVKPQDFATAAQAAAAFVGPNTLAISVMAGAPLYLLAQRLGVARVIRAMPNIAGQIGQGVTAFVAGPGCAEEDSALAAQLLAPLGPVERLYDERLMDVVTAVSGSGPAYLFLLTEALAAAGEAEGLEPAAAERLARQTMAGAAALMLETGASAATLRKQVTSPGGTTQAALDVLQGPDGLGPLIRRAVRAAAERAVALGRGAADG